jgi:hypothetical protein
VLGIATGSYGYVEVEFEIHAAEPGLDVAAWDHLVEDSLEKPDGELQVAGCMGRRTGSGLPMGCACWNRRGSASSLGR